MAKAIQTVSPDVVRSLLNRIEQLERKVMGGLNGDEPPIPLAPDDVVAMTPVGGIAARSGTTCYGEDCELYVVTDADLDDGEFELTALVDGAAAPLTAMVYNLANEAVGAAKYVVTARLKSGHRYVVVESCDAEA